MLKKPHRRTRDYSNPHYRLSKQSVQNIVSKNSGHNKLLSANRDELNQQNQKRLSSQIKPPFNLSSSSWCLLNSNNNQFIGYRECQQRQVASLTKIMTTILCLNLMQKYGLEKEVGIKVSKASTNFSGTSAQLKQGKWIKLEDLLYGTMLPSGNDAAYLLSEVMGLLLFYQRMKPEDKQYADIQSIDITLYDNTLPFISRFLKEMNKLAKELKMRRTTFVNPHGLANALNISSARDMLELTRYACNNKQFLKIASTSEYECNFYNEDFTLICETKIWSNTNRLLRKGWEGVKTGNTSSAGACLASLKNGIYIIVLNCQSIEARFTETQILFQWYVRNFQDQTFSNFYEK